ncbi:hypothetical protein TspCOW1_02350 [Thiohalobacter sp. COW1]|nr:hypothetical protein TspCOW1_02350 [Thiohalobacter sp. COW1]
MVVRMGVDFGTAFTKVAIRAGVDVVLVDWSAASGDESRIGRYVMPGVVCRTPAGEYCWRPTERQDVHGNLKLPVIENAATDDCPIATLAFLALVIRYARAFLYRHPEVGRKLPTRTLRWELNIGCPTEPHERPEVVETFQKIARTAWRLADTDTLREVDIASAWRDTMGDLGLEAEPGVTPEFVAQIAGYLRSPQVNEGLHALVDIGAATVDVATFNVVLPTDFDSLPRIPIFFSAVKSLGTHYLSHNRYSRLGMEPTWDDDAPVEPADEMAKRLGRQLSEIDALDGEFTNKVSRCITAVIDGTRTSRRGDPRSEAWKEGLPIFVTGGGAACELYRRAIEKAQDAVKSKMGPNRRFRFIELDSLSPASRLSGDEIGTRVTVAIGLTEDADNIARVVPHRDIKPISHSRVERVDHTEIYGD